MTAIDRLDQIEARANAATMGPWEAYRRNPGYRIYEICSTTPQGLDETLAEVSGYNASDDADFSAHARTDVPWLIEQVRQRDAQIAELRSWAVPCEAVVIDLDTAPRPALVAALRAVHQIAFDPDTINALEHGAIEFGPNLYQGVSTDDALGYARDTLRDIRRAIEEALS